MTCNTRQWSSYESILTCFAANTHQRVSREFDLIFINDDDNDNDIDDDDDDDDDDTSIVHLLRDSTQIYTIMHWTE